MAKGKQKDKPSVKEERKARKTEVNRTRDKGKHRRGELDSASLASFTNMLRQDGYELVEVQRDGNCFFRSLADQLENNENAHDSYRQRICTHLKAHEADFSPFMSFGESEESEDKDFESYVERMGADGEWAGQVELIAAAQALRVNIIVHQLEHPSYRIDCAAGDPAVRKEAKPLREIHISYHDGEHYNSVHSKAATRPVGAKNVKGGSKGGSKGGNEGEPAVDANGAADDGGKSAKSAQVDEVASALDAVDISEKVAANGHGVLSAADGDEDDATALEKDVGADEDTKRAAPAAPPMSGIEKARDAKARKKEEKRARKEQRHREAVAAAQGAVEDESADGENTASERTSSSNSIITL